MKRKNLKFASASLLPLLAGVLLAGAAAKEQRSIARMDIANALNVSGVRVTSDQIELLGPVVSSKPNPRLKVVSVIQTASDSAQIRLRCESSKICLPFYVLVHWPAATKDDNPLAKWQDSASRQRRLLKKEEILVHSGKSATLVFEGQNVRMTLPVLCLQSGARGQQVRVMSIDRKRIYIARVAGEGNVRAGVRD